MKNTLTAETLLAGSAPVKIQRAFEGKVRAALNVEDSASGDREVRRMVAETFAEIWNEQAKRNP